jgi:hypothetical protein
MRNLFAPWCVLGLLALLQLGAAAQANPPRRMQAPAQAQSQALQIFLDRLTPSSRELAQNALNKLTRAGREKVERDFEEMRKLDNLPGMAETNALLRQFGLPQTEVLATFADCCMDILRSLPRDQQQPFMNGVFGVSRAEAKFAQKLILEYTKDVQEMSQEIQRMNQRLWDR